jgi:hypothetical protein
MLHFLSGKFMQSMQELDVLFQDQRLDAVVLQSVYPLDLVLSTLLPTGIWKHLPHPNFEYFLLAQGERDDHVQEKPTGHWAMAVWDIL